MNSTITGLQSLQIPGQEKLDLSVNHNGSTSASLTPALGGRDELSKGFGDRNLAGGSFGGGGSGGGPGGGIPIGVIESLICLCLMGRTQMDGSYGSNDIFIFIE